MKTKTKTFDCVDMMHEGALRIYQETKGMTIEEEVAYWQRPRKLPEKQKQTRKTHGADGNSPDPPD